MTDMSSGSGVVIELREFLNIICGKSKADVVNVCLEHYEAAAAAAESDAGQWREYLRKAFEPLSDLNKKMKLDDVRDAVASCADIRGEVGKYNVRHGEMNIENNDKLLDLLACIMAVCPKADNLPPIESISIWASERLNGWEVPIGVPCVVFNDDEVFERVLNPCGKAVKKLFGSCESISWTEVSY